MTLGPRWAAMTGQTRAEMASLSASDLPETPGVYAFFRDGAPVYVGEAKQTLRSRVWGNHRSRGVSMTNSAFRRNVAEHLDIASAPDLKAKRYLPTPDDAARVVAWIDGCEIAWIVCDSGAAAHQLEAELKAEFRPPLTKR